jgi:hypothetical protein
MLRFLWLTTSEIFLLLLVVLIPIDYSVQMVEDRTIPHSFSFYL